MFLMNKTSGLRLAL